MTTHNTSGANNNNWKGGVFINENGYRRVKIIAPTGRGAYRYEHRYLMEQHLGRSLNSKEAVHHINGDKLDNRLENLVVMSLREHALLHNELAPQRICWVCEEKGTIVKHFCWGFCKSHYEKYARRKREKWYG